MIVGGDFASVDGDGSLKPTDWAAAKAFAQRAGAVLSFMLFRAAYGTWIDTSFQAAWLGARGAGLVRGAYLLLRFPYAPTGYKAENEPPEEQVRALAHGVGTHDDYDFVPAIDIEFPGHGLIDTGMTPSEALDWIRRAWREFVNIYGVPPMIYTSARVWSEDLHNLPAPELAESFGWFAKPWVLPTRSPAQMNGEPYASGKLDPQIPAPWGVRSQDWWLHQYQGDARGIGETGPDGIFHGIRQADLSRFNVMRQGEKSVRVTHVRKRLGLTDSDLFDESMASHVAALQQELQLVPDAIIGPKTLAPIMWRGGVEKPIAPAVA